MPIYEYRCNSCRRKVSLFVRGFNAPSSGTCSFCGGTDLTRLMSAFAHHRTEADRLAELKSSDLNDPSFYKDNRNVGLWAKKRVQELGGDVPTQFDEIVEKGRTGKLLDEVGEGI